MSEQRRIPRVNASSGISRQSDGGDLIATLHLDESLPNGEAKIELQIPRAILQGLLDALPA